MPTALPMALAVIGWSPVTMITCGQYENYKQHKHHSLQVDQHLSGVHINHTCSYMLSTPQYIGTLNVSLLTTKTLIVCLGKAGHPLYQLPLPLFQLSCSWRQLQEQWLVEDQ